MVEDQRDCWIQRMPLLCFTEALIPYKEFGNSLSLNRMNDLY